MRFGVSVMPSWKTQTAIRLISLLHYENVRLMTPRLFATVALAWLLLSCSPQTSPQVSLYYYNPALDQDSSGNVQCTNAGLVPVQREASASLSGDALIEETIRMLISGTLTPDERAQGITTQFPLEGLALTGSSLEDGQLTLAFEDLNFSTSGGACRATVLWAQIEKTALQFPGVERVKVIPQELFQP